MCRAPLGTACRSTSRPSPEAQGVPAAAAAWTASDASRSPTAGSPVPFLLEAEQSDGQGAGPHTATRGWGGQEGHSLGHSL